MRLKREAEQGTGRHGGARPGAGRPVGSHLHAKLTEKTLNLEDVVHSRRALVQQIEGSKYDPLLVLVSIAANTRKPDELRLQAAGIACKYVHAALSSATVSTLHKTVDSGAALAELSARLERLAPVVDVIPVPEPEAPEQRTAAVEGPCEEPQQPKLVLVQK
jgi:hypothetical protein